MAIHLIRDRSALNIVIIDALSQPVNACNEILYEFLVGFCFEASVEIHIGHQLTEKLRKSRIENFF